MITRAPASMKSTCRSRTSWGSSISTRPDQRGVGGDCERRSSSWPMPPSVRITERTGCMVAARALAAYLESPASSAGVSGESSARIR